MSFFLLSLVSASATSLNTDQCLACVFQRKGNLPYILRRAIHQSGPDENQSFGHCFVCIRCPDDPRDYCRGWWPSDPDGGDYEGDDGRLNSDHDEQWHNASCQAVSWMQSESLRAYLQQYESLNQYQVINKGDARSCLGFCEDSVQQLGWDYRLPWGNLTIPGRMRFPQSSWQSTNKEQQLPPELLDRLWQRYFSDSQE